MRTNEWNFILMFLYIFFFMFIAKLIKEKLGLFKSIVFPTSLLAGFLGLIFGPEVLGKVDIVIFIFDKAIYLNNLGLKYDINFYENILFFFMIIGFTSLTLTERQSKQNSDSLVSGIFIVSTYVLQGLFGLGTLYFLAWTYNPDLFAGIGLMLPLAFGQGPAFASSIGGSWDLQTKIGYIQQFGLTLAAVGFIVGGIGGVIMLNYYIRKYNLKPVKLRELKGVKTKSVDFSSLSEVNFYDNLLVQIVWLALILILTFIISSYVYNLIHPLGGIFQSLASLIIGLSYLFGVFIAMGFRGFLRFMESRGHRTNHLVDDYLMHNIASLSLNIMITASIMAIDIEKVKDYWVVLLAVTVVGTIVTYFYCVYLGRYVFRKNPIHYILTMFGMLTGVASTGLALLRGIDPDLETDTADNVVVLGSAIASPIGLPIMILLGVQVLAYTENNNIYNIITIVALLGYFILLLSILIGITRRRSLKNKI